MRHNPLGAVACVLALQALAQPPLTFDDLLSRARTAPGQWRTEALLAEQHARLQETKGFLREGPTLSLLAGPRRIPGGSPTTDQGFEVELPLFLAPKIRADLEASLGRAHPWLEDAARRERHFRLRTAYLDAWLAARVLALKEAGLGTVEAWLKAARARFEAGADPAFQVALVEGERLRIQQELDEARIQEARLWGTLAALAEVPATPVPLADPGTPEIPPAGDLARRREASPLRRALLAQAELETRGLRLQESLALSRWSLRGSYAQEGPDSIARLGIALRLPRPGESAAIRRTTEARIQAVQGEARQALADLDARTQSAVARIPEAPLDAAPPDFRKALEAIGLRLQEGRERPSEALPIRRQLLESQVASLQRIHAMHLLDAELQNLLPEVDR